VHHGLTDILVDAGVVTPAQVQDGLVRQRETGLRIGETLVEIGAATEEDIGWALARQLGLPLVDLQNDTLDPELLGSFPAGVLYRLQAVPLLRSEEGLSFALSDPTDLQVVSHLETLAGCPVLPSVATPSAIRRVLAPRLGAHVGAANARPGGAALGGFVVWDRSGANFLHFQLHAAQRAGASAIHFVPDLGGVRVYQRGPAGVTRVASESSETFESLLTQLELIGVPVGAMAGELHRRVHVDCPMGAGTLRLEVVLLTLEGATTVTLRLPSAGGVPATLEALGLNPVDTACIRDVLQRPAGLVLVSGPAGSGCTTTLACLLAAALREDRSAMVFGDVPLPRPAGGLAFALPTAEAGAAWESIVTAHEPDLVVLDDLVPGPDVSTFAAGAGMGRLVLARARWGDTFALLEHAASHAHWRSAVASRLHLVVQQRLLPCAAAADGAGGGSRAYFEVLVVGDALREAIRSHASARELRQLADAAGFRSLDQVLREELRAGRLDPDAVSRALAS
jgi:type II secretory ATPase GspE/PulE/Tfp pilus assembly ATPase PilB-like protein